MRDRLPDEEVKLLAMAESIGNLTPEAVNKIKSLAQELVTLREQNQWISVETRLPDLERDGGTTPWKQVTCIVVCNMGVLPAQYESQGYAKTEKGRAPRWKWYGHDRLLYSVTHWMPLPAPPSPAEQDQGQ